MQYSRLCFSRGLQRHWSPFPKCATNIELSELLDLAKDINSYKIVDTCGFPFDKKNDILGSKGDCVIPVGLAQNVEQLHEYLFGDKDDYTVSSTLQIINDKIVNDTGVSAPKKTESSEGAEASVEGEQ